MIDRDVSRRRLRKRKEGMKKGVYLLPNLLTSASLFGGFYSIVAALDGRYEVAAIAILISAVLDGLDGRIARLTGTTSRFGMEYDSLADLVAFGLAPGFLIFVWAVRPFGRYGWLAAFLYVVCGALRLARYNVEAPSVGSKRFNGLPIPAAAAFIAATVLLFHYIGQAQIPKHIAIPVIVYCLAFLMISNVKFHSFKELNFTKRMPFILLVGAVFLLILIAAEPQVMLFILTFGYVVSGPVMWIVGKRKKEVSYVHDEDEVVAKKTK
ncbi:CDP-diacylglycerol--serine O-phosphatidyltransferase @ Archaetidylserine synthase [hydrothermal vent metagenome]|uniref:CDP-diacylglycerol--serine O-phosphatidyltransferase n=1 Tax=hydrothermal vent metagenome TaxID=652676 RepID=A0A3B0RIM6_9ZZZZ